MMEIERESENAAFRYLECWVQTKRSRPIAQLETNGKNCKDTENNCHQIKRVNIIRYCVWHKNHCTMFKRSANKLQNKNQNPDEIHAQAIVWLFGKYCYFGCVVWVVASIQLAIDTERSWFIKSKEKRVQMNTHFRTYTKIVNW